MNYRAIAFGVTLGAMAHVSLGIVRGEQAESKRPPPSADYSRGFCSGWNGAVALERQRFANWRTMLVIGRTAESEKTDAGQVLAVVINSVALYVLLGNAVGDTPLPDGTMVNCPPEQQPVPGQK